MKQYKVTLNFTFEPEYVNDIDGYESDEGYASANYNDDSSTKVDGRKREDVGHRTAFERTEAYYEKHSVEKHVKENDPLAFVENVICEGEVVEAKWDKKKFQIHMVVNTEQTKEELIHDLEWNSLEDGEYEACCDTGWIVMTRGPNGEVYDGNWDTKDYWVYGLTDYRQNPIEVELIGDVPEVPAIQELATLTEKGISFHATMKEMKESGRYFSSEEEKVFKMLCILMGDRKMYGTQSL
jgi:hypothetical protein